MCAIIPAVKNPAGQIVDSKLFTDLMEYTGSRTKTSIIYKRTVESPYLRANQDKFQFDENRQPTLQSLLKNFNISSIITEEDEKEVIGRKVGSIKKDGTPVKYRKEMDAYQKALQFNKTNPMNIKYVVAVERGQNTTDNYTFWALKVYPKTAKYALQVDKMEYNHNLNSRLEDILATKGVSVGALTQLEESLGAAGVTDFSAAKSTAEGLIEVIRLAKGEEGQKALPEEFSHFMLEATKTEPIVQRFMESIRSNELLQRQVLGEQYERYLNLYGNDSEQIVEEVAGKLVSDKLQEQDKYSNLGIVGRLLSRTLDKIKEFFSKWNTNEIQQAILDSHSQAGQIAKDMLSGALGQRVSIENISSSYSMYNLQDRVTRDKDILQKLVDNEKKRLQRYIERDPGNRFETIQTLFIEKLENQLRADQEIEGIYSFIDNTLKQLKSLEVRLHAINTGDQTIGYKARILRDVRDFIYSYKGVSHYIQDALLDEETQSDSRYDERVRVALDQAISLISRLETSWSKTSMPIFLEFIRPIAGDSITAMLGKDKGKTWTLEDIVKYAESDIGFFDRWLDSMAESSDKVLPILDQAVKKAKGNARLDTNLQAKELVKMQLELEQSGIPNTEWMYELDTNGNTTGNLVQDINYGQYYQDLANIKKEATDKHGVGSEEARKIIKEWVNNNTTVIEDKRVPRRSKYENKVYSRLTASQKKFYDKYMEYKEMYESYLPENKRSKYKAVQVRKDLVERVKSSTPQNAVEQLVISIKNGFLRRVDDEDFGKKRSQDFEGNPVQSLPIYYTERLENSNEISKDAISSMIAFGAMANDFNEMNKIVDVLEVGRDILRQREIALTEGNRTLKEQFNYLGSTITRPLIKRKDSSQFQARMEDFFEMQVYGRYLADEGTFVGTTIDKAKTLDNMAKITAINGIALNLLSGVSNVLTGSVMMRLESIAGEYFKYADTLRADREYIKEMPAFLSELGNRAKSSKLGLFDELFDVLQDYEKDTRNADVARKTWFSRMFNTSSLFVLNNAGEHWMQNRTAMALASNYQMKSNTGKVTTLWDSLEAVPLDKNNSKNGSELVVKQGYTKMDGSKFERQDILDFSNKSKAINQRMHGIYNNLDKSAVQRLAVGRLAIMFRKWIKPSLNRRFSRAQYNYDMKEWTEGYYNTATKFIVQLYKDMKQGQFEVAANWDKLNKTERANLKRAATESAHFLLLVLAVNFIDWPDDKKNNPWYLRMLEYQTRRLYTEIGALTPTPAMAFEGLKILKSPSAAIGTFQDSLGLIKLLWPWNYMDELEVGKYKGHSTAYKAFINSPLAPIYRTVERGLHPEESLAFFKGAW